MIKQGPIEGTERKWNMNKFLAKQVASKSKARKNKQSAKRSPAETERLRKLLDPTEIATRVVTPETATWPAEIAEYRERCDQEALIEAAAVLGIDLTDPNDEYAQKVLKAPDDVAKFTKADLAKKPVAADNTSMADVARIRDEAQASTKS